MEQFVEAGDATKTIDFIWKMYSIHVRSRLKEKGVMLDSVCPKCGSHEETLKLDHAFRDCV